MHAQEAPAQEMPAQESPQQAVQAAEGRNVARLVIIGFGALFALAVVLWARYGSAVFMETMANAWAYCF